MNTTQNISNDKKQFLIAVATQKSSVVGRAYVKGLKWDKDNLSHTIVFTKSVKEAEIFDGDQIEHVKFVLNTNGFDSLYKQTLCLEFSLHVVTTNNFTVDWFNGNCRRVRNFANIAEARAFVDGFKAHNSFVDAPQATITIEHNVVYGSKL